MVTEVCEDILQKAKPGHRDVLPCFKQDLDIYCDFIERKERVFRELVDEPADH